MASFSTSDLVFILQQIQIAEQQAAGADLLSLLPNPEVGFGLRTLDGTFNNLIQGQSQFGAADLTFPRLVPANFLNDADGDTFDANGPAPGGLVTNTNYALTGNVADADPRTISNLLVDFTISNPAAVQAYVDSGQGVLAPDGTLLDLNGVPIPASQTLFIPNITADAGLSAPFNSWMTFFGQFFDHGLDLVTKGGSGTVFIPLQPDDPLYVPGSPTNFMVLTRATLFGPGLNENTTSPFVDQNQTYTSHPSHQVFLRAYELNAAGDPVATGRLITNRDLGADGRFGGTGANADTEIGGMATWKVVKAQARDLLGINLTDADVSDVPLLATDLYGNFIKGLNGLPMVMMKGADGLADTADDFLVEGNLAAPISLANAVRTGHQFLIDIAHTASPVNGQTGAALAPDADGVAGGPVAAGFYDNELLDAHYIAGDGRVNENIGLTAVHSIFHAEHNRLVQNTKDVALASNDLALLNAWLMPDAQLAALPTAAQIAGLHWNGERLFQAAKLGTEMQYQHLVFEEFARTVQPNVDAFIDFDNTINPAIVAEFAHAVFRLGHSMLTETIDRLDPNFASTEIGLIEAFLNPLAFKASGPTPEQASSAIIRGLTRQVGNEIDEFVTEAVRNNLLGLPLDLPALNIARGRDTGIPTLNAARREFFAGTGDNQLTPYTSWVDLTQHLKHPESVINFIAAYGTHSSITSALTMDDKRAAAMELVFGVDQNGNGVVASDSLDFINSTGAYANLANGVTITGVDAIDLWVGGLAEEKMPFGGMLGSTFNFVFETQLEALQNGDRLYYLHRLAGTNFVHELENNSFAKLVMLNTDATHLPALIFSTPTYTLEVDQSKQFNANVVNNPGLDGILGDNPLTLRYEAADDIATPNADPLSGSALIPLVIRNNPATATPDTNYLQYTGEDHMVLGGTNPGNLANPSGNDILISGDGDDTLYGDGGNDRLEGGYGNDDIQGGAGDDIITDMGGDDVIKGDDGNDVIHGGSGFNLIIAGRGSDFIVTGEDVSEVIAGEGNDFILGSKMNVQMAGNEGDDWIEIGTQDGAPGDNFDPFGTDSIIGNDIFVGDGTFDEMIGEGGDDIFVGSAGPDKMKGMSGFDWATYKNERFGVDVDFFANAFNETPVPMSMAATTAKFAAVEGLSGSAFSDVLRGDNETAATIVNAGFTGSVLTNIALIDGLQAFLNQMLGTVAVPVVTSFGTGNILLGGAGSDMIEGRGGDDLIDGDRWLNVRISVRANADGTGAQIDSVNSLKDLVPRMLSGEINPGQLVAVREILTATGPNFDTAVFSGNRANYSIAVNGIAFDPLVTVVNAGDIVTVTDNVGLDGIDRLTNIERLQFADTAVVLSGVNNAPVGLLTISDNTPASFQTLTVSAAFIDLLNPGVTDADNVTLTNPTGTITGPIRYNWQFEAVLGSGNFQDILGGAGLPVSGPTFTVTPALEGLNLRVRAVYQDANGVLETVFSAATTAPVAVGIAPPPAAPIPAESATVSAGVHYIRSDLQFILDQIVIAEKQAAGADFGSLVSNPRASQGLRTVDGTFNNLVQGQSEFGAADTTFPRLVPATFLNDADGDTFDANGPAPGGLVTNTNYGAAGNVADADPRIISNLIADMTANNPAAVAANGGAPSVMSPGLDGVFGTIDDRAVFLIPNVSPDAGLSAPFNTWMTFFGQFFDHGLDLLTKGGNGTVFIPLQADDPLIAGADGIFGNGDDLPAGLRFMAVTRATLVGGPGLNENTTSPFVDQNQTYASHPSHQVFLRAYELNAAGDPVATGRLITNRNLGADGNFGGTGLNADTEIGGMATWAVVKAQARALLGINLTDADFDNVPLLRTDAYGNFIKGPGGMPLVITGLGLDGIPNTADDVVVEGDPTANGGLGISLTTALRTGHQFLIDIAHSANPRNSQTGALLTPDADNVIGGPQAPGTYDNELLDKHYIAGDGRVNENIGLTAVHSIFHSEHNRLVQHTKDVAIASNDVTFLNQWLLSPVATLPTTQAAIDALQWNGERLFQAAKFGTEMQYQHLVFEEFARTIQPQVDVFVGPTQGYDANINPAIVAEFAHAVYRLGHSMLTETIDRLDPNFVSSEIGLIQAFLNPLAFAASGPTPEQATGAIVRGLTRQVGNEIDEFVTEALRNNLVGLPLDLPAINIARARDTGVPTLNAARRDFHNQTGDSNLTPYTSWADLVQHLKHPESLINFIAAYGTHSELQTADVNTLAEKRAVATALVLGGSAVINAGGVGGAERTFTADNADRLAFLNSTGAFANLASGVTTTGVDAIDLWIGGLAEEKMPFGGMLGSTFNFVFENQMEKLQNGDRLYYLDRTAGLNFGSELENNSFAKLVMANTDATHLPGLLFSTPTFTLEVDRTKQFNASVIPGPDGILLDNPLTRVNEALDNLPGNTDPVGGVLLTPLVIRDNPNTVGLDANYLQYTGEDHVVMGGTAGNDIIISSIGDDTLWGDAGNDRIEGGYGNDLIRAGAGDDIITDIGGDDNIQGDAGNDVIQGGNGLNVILGGFGSDFIVTGEDSSDTRGGPGNDFILGSKTDEQNMGNEGDDWIETGTADGAPGDNFDPNGLDTVIGNDVFIGDGGVDIFNAEGGDDIMVGSEGVGDKYLGASGFDWATFKNEPFGVNIDLGIRAFNAAPLPVAAGILAKFAAVEGLSGSAHSDVLHGDDATAAVIAVAGAQGSVLTNIALIDGLQAFLDKSLNVAPGTHVTSFGAGNIILGGAGSDSIEGHGGDDLIDGDKWLNVRISVRQNIDGTGPEIASFDSMRPMVPLMLNGTYNPGQLQIVREILTAAGPDFDTAVFSGNKADYTVAINDNGTVGDFSDDIVTVTDNVGLDGTDRLTHIEHLRFADQSQVLVPGLNNAAVGSLILNDSTPAVGQVLTVSAASVGELDNATTVGGAITGPIAYFWQSDPGTGVFTDIVTVNGAGVVGAIGPNFTVTPDLAGLALRVRAVYQDGHGVLENVFSAPTALTTAVGTVNNAGTVTIIDTSPTEGTLLATTPVADADVTGPVTYQWQVGGIGAIFTDITGATGATFTPTQAQVGMNFRVMTSYTDNAGNLEQVFSAATGGVGDQVMGTAVAETLTGTPFDDDLQGLGGNDILIGGKGADAMSGGSGDDIYEVTEVGDVVTEAASQGIDTVWTSLANYTLTANVENLMLGGPGSFTGTGNGLNNLIGGGKGNDVLIGGAGADTMIGGLGNDTYEVDATGDVVIEVAGEGSDTIKTTLLNYTLGANLETLMFIGTGNFTGSGNDFSNSISGGGGNDTLSCGAGADVLSGGGGNDTLIGGTGFDIMFGGKGDDLYFVTKETDVVQEFGNDGLDAIFTSASFALNDFSEVENLIFSGSGSFSGSGNIFDNKIQGGNGGNVLSGGGGNDMLIDGTGFDIMFGGSGDDVYFVTKGSDVVQEFGNEGVDTIFTTASYALNDFSEVENLVFNGSGSFIGSGNIFNNIIKGGAGNDTLTGGGGQDTLTGGLGADTFVLTELADSGVGAARDIITDFLSGTDHIQFTGIDANTLVAGDQAFAFVGNALFSSAAGQLRYDVVGGDTVIQGDVNGDGVADFELQLTGIHSFVAADLML